MKRPAVDGPVKISFGGGALIGVHVGYEKGPLKGIKFVGRYGVSAGAIEAAGEAYLGEDGLEQLLTTDVPNTAAIFATKDDLAEAGDLVFRGGDGFVMGYAPLFNLLKSKFEGKLPSVPVTVGRLNNNTGRLQHVTAYPDGSFSTDADDLGIVATQDDFIHAILSSCLTYPIVDMYVDQGGKLWQDGGFREGGPVVRAILDGATELHICLTGMFSSNCNFANTTGGDPLNCITRTMETMANQNVISAVNVAIKNPALSCFIYQCQPQGSSTNFNETDMKENIAIGEATVAVAGKDLTIAE